MENVGRDVKALMRKLLLNSNAFFSNGYLNSEGRKVFEEMARFLVYEKPFLKRRIRRVRKEGSLEEVVRLAESILGEEAVSEILRSQHQGPYAVKGSPDEALASLQAPGCSTRLTDKIPSSPK
ncbi:hypothetical protein [Thermofilum pendens]|uniref:Uncharacterized protein n=1 Tax=Thermofilum pendens (strain DSM 2475 / Hrk 5) TaxID=368408 RepID=A1RWB3_THEPD|nr:hypothetical protein [Thermofilum pendens]ABL77493.1 hypothetical protein Tpen_0083 [Thermofilum pendens Hrk 5]